MISLNPNKCVVVAVQIGNELIDVAVLQSECEYLEKVVLARCVSHWFFSSNFKAILCRPFDDCETTYM